MNHIGNEEECRQSCKEPVLVTTIDYSAAGPGTKLLLGDLNADGRMEILAVQADGGIDDRYVPHQIQCMTAFDLDGKLLWQVGSPSREPGGFGSDFPAQIYDIDGDGFNEVLCVMEKTLRIYDGRNGTLKRERELPGENAHDCIIIANLTGRSKPGDIILKNRYRMLWALDNDLKLLWTFEGNPGHFPWAYDINGDGFDEVMAGYDMLDHNGKILWSCRDLNDHADCIWIGDVDGNPENGAEVIIGGSVTVMYSGRGEEIWRYDGCIESQHVALGKFRDDIPGIQIAGLDRIIRGDVIPEGTGESAYFVNPKVGKDGMFLLDSQGKEIWKEDRKTSGWLTIVETLHNWDGNGKDYILAFRRGGGVMPALYDGFGNPVVSFPLDGYVIHADLMGMGQENVIVYQNGLAAVFSGSAIDLRVIRPGTTLPQTKRLYSSTLYPGGELNK